MDFSGIHKILYGPLRPWIAGELDNLMQGEVEALQLKVSSEKIVMLHNVETPSPVYRATMRYAEIIDRDIETSYGHLIESVEHLDEPVDKMYEVTRFRRRLMDLAGETERLSGKIEPESHTEAHFAVQYLQLKLVNLLADSGLRYCDYIPGDTAGDVNRIYLETVDKPVPTPDPYYRTMAWYQKELADILLHYEPERQAPERLTGKINRHLTGMAEAVGRAAHHYDMPDVQAVLHHAENAIFLIKMEASFLRDDTAKLVDEDYCRQWVEGLMQDLTEDNGNQYVERLQGVYEAYSEIENLLQPVDSKFQNLGKSRARRWGQTLTAFIPSANDGADPYCVEQKRDMSDISGFVKYFKAKFIHKSELETALGVDRKTLKGYLEEADIRKLKLKSNKWYYRPDVEAFFEERMETED